MTITVVGSSSRHPDKSTLLDKYKIKYLKIVSIFIPVVFLCDIQSTGLLFYLFSVSERLFSSYEYFCILIFSLEFYFSFYNSLSVRYWSYNSHFSRWLHHDGFLQALFNGKLRGTKRAPAFLKMSKMIVSIICFNVPPPGPPVISAGSLPWLIQHWRYCGDRGLVTGGIFCCSKKVFKNKNYIFYFY